MATTYANDIHPLFRPGDITCMARHGAKLGDSSWMCDAAASHGFADHGNARMVFSRLSNGTMPPDGAWPKYKIDICSQWITDGFLP